MRNILVLLALIAPPVFAEQTAAAKLSDFVRLPWLSTPVAILLVSNNQHLNRLVGGEEIATVTGEY